MTTPGQERTSSAPQDLIILTNTSWYFYLELANQLSIDTFTPGEIVGGNPNPAALKRSATLPPAAEKAPLKTCQSVLPGDDDPHWGPRPDF